jgi:hypothetical protein
VFTDTWAWNMDAEYAYNELTTSPPANVAAMIEAMRQFVGANEMMAYLVMMTQRIKELHRVLKSTGSLYLHCDPTASHYLKILLDTVFGKDRFLSEISWRRTGAHSDGKQGRKNLGHIRDVILFYSKSNSYVWNTQFTPYGQSYIESSCRHVEPGTGRRFRLDNLSAAKPGGDTSYEWHGVKPYKGRFWAHSRAKMEAFEREGRLVYSSSGMPNFKRYLDEMPGVPLQDSWDDITPAFGNERLGYPTQKPLALLERIIEASSNPGDVVLEPFCGCGTAVVAAQKLGCRWIGIDITHLAVTLIKTRMSDHFGPQLLDEIEVHGEPTDLGAAQALFDADPFQFEWWALSLVRAMPGNDQKKGADKGVDGIIRFHVDNTGKTQRAIVQVKGGKVQSSAIRDLRGTMNREKSEMAILITLQPPTSAMTVEAANAGVYTDPTGLLYPAIQILTIEELLQDKEPRLPHGKNTFRKAGRISRNVQAQLALGGTAEDADA